jgi:hypothetical protein
MIFNSLYCGGVYLALQEGMILDNVGKYLESKFGYWYNPIGGCLTCMASLHSWIFIFVFGLTWLYIPYVFALACINTIIASKFIHD